MPSFSYAWDSPPVYSTYNYTLSSGFAMYGFVFNFTGTRLYALTNYTGSSYRVEQYNLTTAWRVDTAIYSTAKNITVSNTVKLTYLSEDGTKMYISEGGNWDMQEFTMSTPWDISTLTNTETDVPCGNNYVLGVGFALGGTHYVASCGDGSTRSYDLNVAWNFKSGTNSKSVDFGVNYRPQIINWNDDGLEFLAVVSTTGIDYIKPFVCSVAYDVSSCVAGWQYDYSTREGQGSSYDGMWATNNGDYLYHSSGAGSKKIWQYTISTNSSWGSSYFDEPNLASTSNPFSTCGFTDLPCHFGNVMYKIFTWLFVPSAGSTAQFDDVKESFNSKVPFYYFNQVQQGLSLAVTNPASASFSDISFNMSPFGEITVINWVDTKTEFDTLFGSSGYITLFTYLLWTGFIVYVIARSSTIFKG